MLIHGAVDNDIHPPRFGGAQRSFGLYRGLAAAHQVNVLCVVPNRNRASREERAAGVTLIRRRAWYTSLAWRLERARLAPLFSAAYAHRARARRLLQSLPGSADVLAVDFHLTGLFTRSRARLKVYLAQNVEYDHFRATQPPLLLSSVWAGRVRAFEAHAVRSADRVVVVGEEDQARMRELYGLEDERTIVIPNGWDEHTIRPPSPAERASARAAIGAGDGTYVAVFLASDVPHNRTALAGLLDRVLPALGGDSFRILVAGSITRALPRALPASVIARGEVEDLGAVLHAADAGLNPASEGGGSNVKLPTYLGAGLAAVSTRFGLRGFAALEPHVTAVPLERFAEALRARPRGWAAACAPRPEAVSALAWGRLGAALGARLTEALERPASGDAVREPRRARA